MVSDNVCAILANRVYNRATLNRGPIPDGWVEVPGFYVPDNGDGFSAGAYRNSATNEIVIAYTGTNAANDWAKANSQPRLVGRCRYLLGGSSAEFLDPDFSVVRRSGQRAGRRHGQRGGIQQPTRRVRQDLLIGGFDTDHLFGDLGEYVLIGALGTDTLDGLDAEGGDELFGGEGFDTYYADGGDIIRDSDGVGEIFVGADRIRLTGGSRDEDSELFVSDDGWVFYEQLANGNVQVRVAGSAGVLTVEALANVPRSREDQQGSSEGGGGGGVSGGACLWRAARQSRHRERISAVDEFLVGGAG